MKDQDIDSKINSIQEDIKKGREHIQQLENQKNRILKRDKVKQRKEWTRQLIVRGAVLEKYLPAEEFCDIREVDRILKVALSSNEVRMMIKEK